MKSRSKWQMRIAIAIAAFASACLPVWQPAQAQLSTAILRGHITLGQTPAKAGVQVIATNVANGFTTHTLTREDGSYALTGLDPGDYRIEVKAEGYDQNTQVVTLQVGESADLDIAVTQTSADVQQVVVVGKTIVERKTSEVGTVITQKQIQSLPQITRNFLSFADLAPGVSFTTGTDGSTKLQGGAQATTAVNIYIDGVGQKNYVLQGGITGQDSSRGNPFPQSAIKEYKVVSQNYKAEFDQVSSAAIIAVSQSGTNEFRSDVFWDHTSASWRDETPAEKTTNNKAPSFQNQFGVSLGGPIITNVAHYFFAYEGKRNKDPKTISFGSGANAVPVPPSVLASIGGSDAPFNEDLFFGKIDWALSSEQRLELSTKVRREDELTDVGGQNSVQWATLKTNDETRVDLKHQYNTDDWINEAHVTYERAYWSPRPNTIGPGSLLENPQGGPIINVGGGRAYQNKGQRGESFQDDFTWTSLQWNGSHVLKFGAKVKRVTLDTQELQPYNPQYHYDLGYSASIPYRVEFGYALNGVGNGAATSRDLQFGVYGQDDWELTRRLTVNAGLRWDYEDVPSYLNYVTPPDVVAALRGWANINNPNSGFNVNDFISTGSNRSAFKGEFQPRVGASYDLFGDQQHVVFGGYGRSYDRDIFDYLQLERTKQTFPTYNVNFQGDPNHPCTPSPSCVPFNPSFFTIAGLTPFVSNNGAGREIDVIDNHLKIPFSDQISIGIRDSIGGWNTELTYSYIDSRDGFVFLLGNRAPNGAFFVPNGTNPQGPPFGSPIPGFGALILGTSGLQTKVNAVFLKADKLYTPVSGWGVTVAYTFSDAHENRQFDQHYALDFPNMSGYGWLASSGVSKHKVVATGIFDLPRGWEFSSKLTLASGAPIDAIDCSIQAIPCRADQFQPKRQAFIFPGTMWAYRQIDVALSKDFPIGWRKTTLRLRGDILNLFAFKNYDSSAYNAYNGFGSPNPGFGSLDPNGPLLGPTRTFKLTIAASYCPQDQPRRMINVSRMPSGVVTERRRLLALAGALACGCAGTAPGPPPPAPVAPGEPLLDDVERRTFDFFWQTANSANGLVPDRYPTPSPASIAAVGFALTAYPIGVERGWITRAQARDRVLATLRFFSEAPQGPHFTGVTGYQGFFYHFLDMDSGLRARHCELSTVDTALLLAGMLFCQSWFDQTNDDEARIRQLVDAIYARVDWTWAQPRPPLVALGWMPADGFNKLDWRGYDEAMIVYLLALGAPVHAVDASAWPTWCSTYDRAWGTYLGYQHLGFPPLFGHQYSHVWTDFRGIADPYMRARGIDYFENSRRATYSQQAYAIANPGGWKGYDDRVWGLTACDGPYEGSRDYAGSSRRFRGYAARGTGLLRTFDDGTIAPTAMVSSLPFAPEIVLPSLQEMVRRHSALIYSRYGLLDAFNPSFEYSGKLAYGRVVPGLGWVDNDYLGIDQGPIVAMIANHRDGLVWNVMRNNPYLVRGLRRAGFTGGWLGSG